MYDIESNLKARTLGTVCVTILVNLLLALSAYMVHEKQGLASLIPLITPANSGGPKTANKS